MWAKFLKDLAQGKAKLGQKRSSKWSKVRKKHLAENPKCFICEGTTSLEVHHIIPFQLAPEFELESSNLLTLCERKKYGINCHLLVGHLGNYRRINPHVLEDASLWNRKIKGHK